MTLLEFYTAIQTEVNDSDLPTFWLGWEEQTPTTQGLVALLYAMAGNGAFDSVPRKNRANEASSGKRKAKKLLANPRSGA